MASTSARNRRHDLRGELGGTLWLAAAFFTATICLALSLLWLADGDGETVRSMVALAVAAVASVIVASFADSSWSAWRLRTVELGNATRLFAITSILFLIPTVLIGLAPVEGDAADALEARDLDAACPADAVPAVAYADVVVGSAQDRTASCMAWWGVLTAGGEELRADDVVTRAEAAAFLDEVVRGAGEPLRPAPLGAVPEDAAGSEHAAAIGRVAASGIMGGVGEEAFAPAQPVTRAQLSTLVARAHTHVTGGELDPLEDVPFTDVAGGVHADAIGSVAGAGIAVGDGDTFAPEQAVTRGQMLTILARTLDLWVADHGVELPA